MNKDLANPYLEIIIGPMFSGKTSKLLELYRQYTFCNVPILVVNHSFDKRYHQEKLSTHDKTMIPCLSVTTLSDIITPDNIGRYNVILINEAQFFEDINETVRRLVEVYNKTVYVCGLDGDFKRNKFGNLLELIPFADNIIKLHSLCFNCRNGTKAPFTCRLSEETEQTVIGSDNYVPLCRNCYLSK
tara:strand:+ start:128 stop:688 length:561 start_codon:yes stop_codon:yes gene_type:complete